MEEDFMCVQVKREAELVKLPMQNGIKILEKRLLNLSIVEE